MLKISPLLIALFVFSASSLPASAADIPASWKKTMSNDPAVNFYLKKHSAPLGDAASTSVRNLMLARIVGQACSSSQIDRLAWLAYVRSSGLAGLSRRQSENASFLAGTEFNFLDYRELAHLCAGIDYLFGPAGVLIRDVVSKGTGKPKFAYDSRNGFIKVPRF